MKKISTLLLLTLLIFLSKNAKSQNDTLEILILHTNDMHSSIDRMPAIMWKINEIKQNNKYVFLVSAGDMFTGNPLVDKFEKPGFPMIELMNEMGYIVASLGNHEFDYEQENLELRRKQANFPIICANINTSANNVLSKFDNIFELTIADSIKIGFLGLIHREDNKLPASHPAKLTNLSFEDPIKTAKSYKNYKDSFNIFICLSHCGIEIDELLAKKVNFFDVIIGGHSHTVLPQGKKVKNTFIVQAGSKFSYLGVLKIKYFKDKIVWLSDSLISVKTIKEVDSNILSIVTNYNKSCDLNYVIGENIVELTNKQELGALITSAMLDTTKSEIAFQNIGGIRINELPKGPITFKQILELQPFGNTMFVLELTPKEIEQLVRYSYNLSKENELVVGGAKIKLTITQKDKKLEKLEIFDLNGKPLENRKYKVVVNDYMSTAYKLKFLQKGVNTYINDAITVSNYIQKHGKIDFSKQKNIEIIEK